MRLDKQHPVPVYIQLKQLLRSQIEQGIYRPHQKLPSERDLCQHYNAGPPIVNPHMFFGRESDLGKVISLLSSNFVMLTGPLYDHHTSLLRFFDENEFILDDQLYGTFQQDFDALTPDEASILLQINNPALSELGQDITPLYSAE